MPLKATACNHIEQAMSSDFPRATECEECKKTGDSWVHLRTCQTCGVSLCCDSSPNKHATKHFHSTGHPVVQSAEPGEEWYYCYNDKKFFLPK